MANVPIRLREVELANVGSDLPGYDREVAVIDRGSNVFSLVVGYGGSWRYVSALGMSLTSGQILVGSSGNVAAAVTPSGDATISNAGAITIANDAVTYAKMQNVSATDKVLGRSSSGAGNVEEIPCTAFGRDLIAAANAEAAQEALSIAPAGGSVLPLPCGAIVTWAMPSVPDNFLPCDGAEVSRATYADLFAVIGETYGDGDTSTTFEVPDLTDIDTGVYWIIFTGGSITPAEEPDIEAGLVLQLLLGEGTGSTAADEVDDNDGTISGATWSADVPDADCYPDGYSLSFDGTNDSVTVAAPGDLSITDEVTYAVWIKVAGTLGDFEHQPIFSDGRLDAGFDYSGGGPEGRFLSFSMRSAGQFTGPVRASAVVEIDDGSWHHVAGVRGGGLVKLYLDGTLVASSSVPTGYVFQESDVIALGSLAAGGIYFEGKLKDFQVYNVALTSGQVADLAALDCEPPPPAGPLAQSATNTGTGSGGLSATLTAATAGNVLVAVIAATSDSTSDDFNTPSGWTAAAFSRSPFGSNNTHLKTFYKVAAGGETAVGPFGNHASYDGQPKCLWVGEVTPALSSPLDATSTNGGYSGNMTTGTLIVGTSDQYAVAAFAKRATQTFGTPSASFAEVVQLTAGELRLGVYGKDITDMSWPNVTITPSGDGEWAAVIAGFKQT